MRYLVSASHDGSVRVWDVRSGIDQVTIDAHLSCLRPPPPLSPPLFPCQGTVFFSSSHVPFPLGIDTTLPLRDLLRGGCALVLAVISARARGSWSSHLALPTSCSVFVSLAIPRSMPPSLLLLSLAPSLPSLPPLLLIHTHSPCNCVLRRMSHSSVSCGWGRL